LALLHTEDIYFICSCYSTHLSSIHCGLLKRDISLYCRLLTKVIFI